MKEARIRRKRQRIMDHRAKVEDMRRKKNELAYLKKAWEAIELQCKRLGVSVKEFADTMQGAKNGKGLK